MKPVAYDICCGKGGWARGLLAAGFRVIGYDIEEQPEYPGEFCRTDARNLIPVDFIGASLIVASPPCEGFSRHAMPWTRKRNPPPPDMAVIDACRRLGVFAKDCGVPFILENVREAQKWIGKAAWHFGPFYLWGDVPALMPKFDRRFFRRKENRTSGARAERAMVPFDLALHIGKCFVSQICQFCGFSPMPDGVGKYGCPNCHAEGAA